MRQSTEYYNKSINNNSRTVNSNILINNINKVLLQLQLLIRMLA